MKFRTVLYCQIMSIPLLVCLSNSESFNSILCMYQIILFVFFLREVYRDNKKRKVGKKYALNKKK